MLYMGEKKYLEIRSRFPDAMDGDSALCFVADLLDEEARATRKKEPYATDSIRRLERAAGEVKSLYCDIVWEEFGNGN